MKHQRLKLRWRHPRTTASSPLRAYTTTPVWRDSQLNATSVGSGIRVAFPDTMNHFRDKSINYSVDSALTSANL